MGNFDSRNSSTSQFGSLEFDIVRSRSIVRTWTTLLRKMIEILEIRGNGYKNGKRPLANTEMPISASTLIPFACFLQPARLRPRTEYPSFLPPKLTPSFHPSVCSYFALFLSHRHYVLFAGWLRVSIATRHRRQTRVRRLPTHTPTIVARRGRSMRAPTCWALRAEWPI